MKFSIVIPAHNEEKYIKKCLDSIKAASEPYQGSVEVIVVINRCSDNTESIARDYGVKFVYDDSKNLAVIRNRGACEAKGDILVTVDADSRVSENMLQRIDDALSTEKYIGGGVPITLDRMSFGIWTTLKLLNITLFFTGLAGGLYWCYRKDFEAIGGFNESIIMGEDLEFARRLKMLGKKSGKKLIKLQGVSITTSARKGEMFGDWFFLGMLLSQVKTIPKIIKGEFSEEQYKLADKYFYECRNKKDI